MGFAVIHPSKSGSSPAVLEKALSAVLQAAVVAKISTQEESSIHSSPTGFDPKCREYANILFVGRCVIGDPCKYSAFGRRPSTRNKY